MAQNFFIRKNSELPVLKMKVINDGRSDYKKIFDNLENAAVTFSMKEIGCSSCKYKVYNKTGLVIPVTNNDCGTEIEYYIGYKFTKKNTDTRALLGENLKLIF